MASAAVVKMRTEDLRASAGDLHILKGVSLDVLNKEILAVIGPAGSGKTTFLRCLNRLTDLEDDLAIRGRITLDGTDILGDEVDVPALRRKVGMVFAEPAPLPMSILDNLSLGSRLQGALKNVALMERVQRSLEAAFLWDEVKDRLKMSALQLSGGQQQRLCLARSLMVQPDVLLLDEPCSGLDPISTAKIEEALQRLKSRMTLVLVTNNVKQASRCSDRTAFLMMGELVEVGATERIFTAPRDQKTNDYVSGRYG